MGERVSATQRGSRPLHNPVSNIPYGVVQRRSAAFNSPGSAGLYAPWRSGNLNDNGACGIPCANGNNSPANSNWNGSPRHADENKVRTMRAKALYRACGFDRYDHVIPTPYSCADARDTRGVVCMAAGHGPAWRLVVDTAALLQGPQQPNVVEHQQERKALRV